jgi:hypothetical protein
MKFCVKELTYNVVQMQCDNLAVVVSSTGEVLLKGQKDLWSGILDSISSFSSRMSALHLSEVESFYSS